MNLCKKSIIIIDSQLKKNLIVLIRYMVSEATRNSLRECKFQNFPGGGGGGMPPDPSSLGMPYILVGLTTIYSLVTPLAITI